MAPISAKYYHSASELALPATNQGWPEDFGFILGGDGPSYILSVVEGSSAYMAGLQPGDQVLELDGQNVSSLSTKALIALAQTLKTVPPSIGVVSRIEQVTNIIRIQHCTMIMWYDVRITSNKNRVY